MRTSATILVAAGLLIGGGCTRSDELRAKQKAREAGQELKRDLKKAGDEIDKAGRDLKRDIHDEKRR